MLILESDRDEAPMMAPSRRLDGGSRNSPGLAAHCKRIPARSESLERAQVSLGGLLSRMLDDDKARREAGGPRHGGRAGI